MANLFLPCSCLSRKQKVSVSNRKYIFWNSEGSLFISHQVNFTIRGRCCKRNYSELVDYEDSLGALWKSQVVEGLNRTCDRAYNEARTRAEQTCCLSGYAAVAVESQLISSGLFLASLSHQFVPWDHNSRHA